MKRALVGMWLSIGLGFAAMQCLAAAEPPASPASAAATASQATPDKAAKKHRLKFRGKDGTCACDCASGGTSEADIKKAQEARAHASK